MDVGDSEFRIIQSMDPTVARKYLKDGGIPQGTEVSWSKNTDLSPELAALLNKAATSPVEKDKEKEAVIDLLQDPKIRGTTTNDSKGISDGVTMQWSKNSKLILIGFFSELFILF